MLGWDDARPLSGIIDPARAKKLSSKSGIDTVSDLLLHFPSHYVRFGQESGMDDLAVGDYYTCLGRVETVAVRDNHSGRGPRKFLSFTFTDGEHEFSSSLFGYPQGHQRYIRPGALLLLYGKIDTYMGELQLKNPSYITIEPGEAPDGEEGKKPFGAFGPLKIMEEVTGSEQATRELLSRPWIPAYPRRAGTTSPEILAVVDHVLGQAELPDEVLPDPQHDSTAPNWPRNPDTDKPLISFSDALTQIHHPPQDGPDDAIARMKFNEALALQLVMALRRNQASARSAYAIPTPGDASLSRRLENNLPFKLSPGQLTAVDEITQGLGDSHPLNTLLQGDVGSGKTIIALLAMLRVIDEGYQAALIAPTEVLAQQHAQSIRRLLKDAGIDLPVTVLTGFMTKDDRQQALLDIVSGQAQLVIGTHALIQESVEFMDLGLAVVDEQHRFGVAQRDALRSKGSGENTPHMLFMTATPIPRTIAMTFFGDLSTSILSGLPTGRGKITTTVVPEWKPQWVGRAFERIQEEVSEGRQAFIVAPSIEGPHGVYEVYEKLSRGPLSQLRMEVLHSQLGAEEKEEIMARFVSGDIDVLISTTVIEVGVDIPNATVMMVLYAENFGISQLHQLRGRIGRGEHDSLCLLHTEKPADSPSYARLEAVAATQDGFALAELDLHTRTEGDILGVQQSGAQERRTNLLDLSRDQAIIESARDYATALVDYDHDYAAQLVEDIEDIDQEYIERN